jgi:hypothetical protein
VAWGNSWLSLQPSLRLGSASSKVCWTQLCNTGGLCRQAGVSRMAGNYLSKLSVREYNWSSQEIATHRIAVCMRRSAERTDGLIATIQGVLSMHA